MILSAAADARSMPSKIDDRGKERYCEGPLCTWGVVGVDDDAAVLDEASKAWVLASVAWVAWVTLVAWVAWVAWVGSVTLVAWEARKVGVVEGEDEEDEKDEEK